MDEILFKTSLKNHSFLAFIDGKFCSEFEIINNPAAIISNNSTKIIEGVGVWKKLLRMP